MDWASRGRDGVEGLEFTMARLMTFFWHDGYDDGYDVDNLIVPRGTDDCHDMKLTTVMTCNDPDD